MTLLREVNRINKKLGRLKERRELEMAITSLMEYI
jgi:hypothetical protein